MKWKIRKRSGYKIRRNFLTIARPTAGVQLLGQLPHRFRESSSIGINLVGNSSTSLPKGEIQIMNTTATPLVKFSGVKVVVLDIEGTVCPISFVKNVLFPYTLNILPKVLTTQWDSPTFSPYKNAFPASHRKTPEAFETHVKDLISQDLKIPYLKSLQGYLWQSGYESGELKCPLFPDIYPALQKWIHEQNLKIIIYSSGSIAAQKLLFQYTNVDEAIQGSEKGDLRSLIGGYFDTTTAGMKVEKNSYEKIVEETNWGQVDGFLFLSDNVREVEAAKEAGMKAVVVVRDGNAVLTADEERGNLLVKSFAELELEAES